MAKVLEFKCLNQIFAVIALSRKRGRKINSPWSCLSYRTTLLVISKGLWLPRERSLGHHCHNKRCQDCKFLLSSLNSLILDLHGRESEIFVAHEISWGEQPRSISKPSFPLPYLGWPLSWENWIQKYRHEGWAGPIELACSEQLCCDLGYWQFCVSWGTWRPWRSRPSNWYYYNHFHHLSTHSLPSPMPGVSDIA